MTPSPLTLPAEAASVPAARRFVRDTVAALGAAAAGADAEALVSELATNAVLHARSPFTVVVDRAGDRVRICVLDASPTRPRTRDYGMQATTGRGMRLVASLAAAWGVDRQGSGKAVWFELPATGPLAAVPGRDDEADVDVDALLARFPDDGDAEPARTVGRAA